MFVDMWLTPGRFALLLALSIFAAYPEVLLGSQTFYYRDFGFFGYPLAHYHRESFWHGEIPLWNPLNNCGLPFLAQWNTLVLYPGSLFYLLFPLSWSLAVFCLLHQFLAGMGMFCLASHWTSNRLAASVAGVAYAFNGLTLNCLMWPNNIAALGWMPWVVLVSQRAWTGGGRGLVAAAAVAAMQMLSGAPEIILLTWIALAVLAVSQSFQGLRAAGKVWWRFAAVAFLVVGTCAAQLLPFLDLLSHAHRDAGYGDSAWAMPIWGCANLLVPMFHCFRGFHGVYWQPEQYWTSSYYPGAAIVALALLAAVLVRKRNVQVLTFLAVLALILALGDAGKLYGWLRHSIPQFGFLRYPVKFLVLLSFALPLLAAYAVSHLQNSAPNPSQEGNLSMPSACRLTLKRRYRAIAATVWLLSLATIIAVVWYARLHPARDENWMLTWKNGLGRALFLTLTLGGLCLYNRLSVNRPTPASAAEQRGAAGRPDPSQEGSERSSALRQFPSSEGLGVGSWSQYMRKKERRPSTNPPLPPPERGTSSPQAGSPPVDGLGVGSRSQSPTIGRGIHLQQRVKVVAGLALILFLVLDFLTHVPRQNPVIPRKVFEPGLARLSPQPRHGDGRAMISPAINLKLYRFATTNAFNDYINQRRLLFANCNLLDAIPKVNGFYSLYLRDGDAVRAFLYDSTNAPPAPLCDFLGVSHITDPDDFLEWKYRPNYLPLASVGQKPVFADQITTLKAITSAEFDPRQTVYLPLEARAFASAAAARKPTPHPSQEGNFTPDPSQEGNGRSSAPKAVPLRGGVRGGPAAGEQVEKNADPKITKASFTAHRGEIQIEAQGRSWLVIAQNNHHCWRAYSDGTPLRLWQANYAFQATVVPEGKHLVQLVYRDWGFVAGTVLSLLTLTGCIAETKKPRQLPGLC